MFVFPTRKDWIIAPRGRNWKGACWAIFLSSVEVRGIWKGRCRVILMELVMTIDGGKRRWNE